MEIGSVIVGLIIFTASFGMISILLSVIYDKPRIKYVPDKSPQLKYVPSSSLFNNDNVISKD